MTLTTTSDSGNILGNKHTAGSSNHTGSSTMNVQVSSSSTAVAVAAAAAPIAERATVSVTRTRNNIPSTSTTEEMIDDILFMDVSSSSSLSPQQPQESRLLFPAGSDPNSSSSSSNSNNSHHPPQQPPTHFHTVANSALIGYRSVGIGGFGAIMRYIGMPLEKIALYMNSSQVSITTIAGTNSGVKAPSPFQQAITLTFRDGYLAPYRVVGINSMTAWFMQYSVMGIAFQFFDTMLSNALHVQPMYYGRELMEPPPSSSSSTLRDQSDSTYYVRESFKVILSPLLAASLESLVSNRAEVQRFYGPKVFQQVMAHAETHGNLRTINPFVSYTGPAYMANVMRNIIMCQTSFIITPYTYKMYFPQEQKNKTSLFYYGLSLNIFVGNVIAITQQALWGRSLDYLQQNHTIHYTNVIRNGYEREGMSAFFTTPKWMSRVLMNAPAQGTLPWFYNEILPLGEYNFLYTFYHYLYRPFMNIVPVTTSTDRIMNTNTAVPTVLAEMKLDTTTTATTNMERPCNLQRTRTHYGTLPTANPEFDEDDDDDDNNNNLDDRIIEAVETNTTPPHVPHHHHHHKALHHNVKKDPTTSSATATTSPSAPPHEQPPTQR
jgi:hypothetical protein